MGKANKSLKAWVAFVKSVQKKYKLSYKDAIHKAKELKDKGADWMNKGLKSITGKSMKGGDNMDVDDMDEPDMDVDDMDEPEQSGGRKRRRTKKRRGSRSKGRSRGRLFRKSMSRRRAASRKASRSMGLVMGVA